MQGLKFRVVYNLGVIDSSSVLLVKPSELLRTETVRESFQISLTPGHFSFQLQWRTIGSQGIWMIDPRVLDGFVAGTTLSITTIIQSQKVQISDILVNRLCSVGRNSITDNHGWSNVAGSLRKFSISSSKLLQVFIGLDSSALK